MKKTTQGIIALLAIVLIATTGIASAFGGFFGKETDEQREKITQAIESEDYKAWKEAMYETITEENFNKLVEMHKAMPEKRMPMREGMEDMKQHMEEVNQALEAGDYKAWKTVMENCEKCPKMYESVTEENFDTFAKLYKARKSGDTETAKELEEELGLEKCPFGHGMFGRGNFRNRLDME